MAYTKYSLTPANNNAAPPDGAPEGMLPSAVNDTMRDMMAQIRDVGDGIRGGTYTMTAPVITGGSVSGATGSFTSLTDSGNLTFTGTGNRILGDFSNATLSNRVAFQSSTTNGGTSPLIIPNGTATGASIVVSNSSDPVNSSFGQLRATATTVDIISAQSGTGTNLPLLIQTGGAERLRITTGGDVGIGTSSPTAFASRTVLDIVGPNAGNGGLIRLADAAATSVLQIFASTGSPASSIIRTATATALIFGTDTTERMRIDSSGNVGIGKIPSTKLDVNGAISAVGDGSSVALYAPADQALRQTGASGGAWYFDVATGGATNGSFIWRSSNAYNERMRIDSSGNLMLGTTTSGVAGGLTIASGKYIYSVGTYANTSGSAANMGVAVDGSFFRSTSSLKYKKDVENANYGLAEVLKLRPVTYKGKSETDGDKVFGGLIAEEVHEAGLTEFVQYAEDGTPDALAYGNMVSLAFKAIQELKATVDAQAARIAALESK
jgi:hypothetical protein